MRNIPIIRLDRLDLHYAPRFWPFAGERRSEIDAHFIERQREKPAMWNGRVLLMHDHAVDAGALRGSFFETDFASFLAWRDWGYPSSSMIRSLYPAKRCSRRNSACRRRSWRCGS